jgi:hypothetical protein
MNTPKLFIAVCILAMMVSDCKKKEEVPVEEVPVTTDPAKLNAEKTNVKTYEITSITYHGTLQNEYTGSFGGKEVKLLKTTDSTLVFCVPEVASGTHKLQIDLGSVDYSVTETTPRQPDEVLTSVLTTFDAEIQLTNPTPEQVTMISDAKVFKDSVVTLFNKLTADEKRQVALMYEANKAVFIQFRESVKQNFGLRQSNASQADCGGLIGLAAYDCAADNLGTSAKDLKACTRKFVEFALFAGLAAKLSAATAGLAISGFALSSAAAAYILLVEIRPALIRFRTSLTTYLGTAWVYAGDALSNMSTGFSSEAFSDLGVKYFQRPLNALDKSISAKVNYFVTQFENLKTDWNKITYALGLIPEYKSGTTQAALTSTEVSISGISNSKVQLQAVNGQQAKFKSTSGADETFNFNISISRNGFSDSRQVNGAKVIAVNDTIHKIRLMLAGKVWVTGRSGFAVDYETTTEVKFSNCCFSGSYDYYYLFRWDASQKKVLVNGISGFNGYTQYHELVSVSENAWSIVCIPGSNCTPGTVTNFPQ